MQHLILGTECDNVETLWLRRTLCGTSQEQVASACNMQCRVVHD